MNQSVIQKNQRQRHRSILYCREFHAGFTLIELMLSLSLSLLVVLAVTQLFLSSKATYIANEEAILSQETGRHALEIIARAVRQSAYEDWEGRGTARLSGSMESAALLGMDARSLKSTTAAMDVPQIKSVNSSDVLGIRFYGAGTGEQGDGSMLNCAGFSVPSSLSDGKNSERAWSIFFVADDAAGEPELRCKYKGKNSWAAVAIARGVESFQILYGLDEDDDGIANTFLNATQLDGLDNALILVGASSNEKIADKNRKTHWKKIVSMKVAILMHGQAAMRPDSLDKIYDLFGKDYADVYAATDLGTRMLEATVSTKYRNRMRKVFSTTIQLRNQSMKVPT